MSFRSESLSVGKVCYGEKFHSLNNSCSHLSAFNLPFIEGRRCVELCASQEALAEGAGGAQNLHLDDQ